MDRQLTRIYHLKNRTTLGNFLVPYVVPLARPLDHNQSLSGATELDSWPPPALTQAVAVAVSARMNVKCTIHTRTLPQMIASSCPNTHTPRISGATGWNG